MPNTNFIKNLLEKLNSEPVIGGVRIEDSSIQYVVAPDNKAINFSVPLPPGCVQNGIVQNKIAFEEALSKIHEFIKPGKKEEVIHITVCLPPALIFTQSFKVPYIDDKKMNESASLNLQMISPVSDAYMGWQKIGESEGQIELLGAFVQKESLDKIKDSLVTARFQAVTFEFPALGLAKSAAEVIGEKPESVIILEISNDGLDFIILKNNSLYFDYFVSWQKIQGAEKEITKDILNAGLMRELQKVSNFSLSRFKETISEIFYIAPGLETSLSEMFASLGLKASPFPGAYGLPPSLMAVTGCSVKKTKSHPEENQINLGTDNSFNIFFEERVKNFISLWRVIAAIAASFLILLNGGFSVGLALHAKNLERQSQFTDGKNQANNVNIEQKAREFNNLVAFMNRTKNETLDWPTFFDSIFGLIDDGNIAPSIFNISNNDRVISMEARAPSNESVLAFKNVLNQKFDRVDLPLSRTTVNPDGSVNFAISFKLKPS